MTAAECILRLAAHINGSIALTPPECASVIRSGLDYCLQTKDYVNLIRLAYYCSTIKSAIATAVIVITQMLVYHTTFQFLLTGVSLDSLVS